MKHLIFIPLACMLYLVSYGQEEIIKWNENYKLQWSYFGGSPSNAPFFAWAAVGISAKIKYVMNGSTSEPVLEAYAKFDRNKSWSKGELQTDELLKHEQLHFDLAELFARKLVQEFKAKQGTTISNAEIVNAANAINRELDETQKKYDFETNNAKNKQDQERWENYVREELKKYSLEKQNN